MNKNLLLALGLIIVGVGGIYWFFFRLVIRSQETPSPFSGPTAISDPEENLTLSGLLAEIKQAGGFNWESSPKQVSWKTATGELVLMGRGFGYGESLRSGGVDEKFSQLDSLLKDNGLASDSFNVGLDGERRYRKNNFICNLGRRDFEAKGVSELEIACAQVD